MTKHQMYWANGDDFFGDGGNFRVTAIKYSSRMYNVQGLFYHTNLHEYICTLAHTHLHKIYTMYVRHAYAHSLTHTLAQRIEISMKY